MEMRLINNNNKNILLLQKILQPNQKSIPKIERYYDNSKNNYSFFENINNIENNNNSYKPNEKYFSPKQETKDNFYVKKNLINSQVTKISPLKKIRINSYNLNNLHKINYGPDDIEIIYQKYSGSRVRSFSESKSFKNNKVTKNYRNEGNILNPNPQ